MAEPSQMPAKFRDYRLDLSASLLHSAASAVPPTRNRAIKPPVRTRTLTKLPLEVLEIIACRVAEPTTNVNQTTAYRHLWSFATASRQTWHASQRQIPAAQVHARAMDLGSDNQQAPLQEFKDLFDAARQLPMGKAKLQAYVIEQIEWMQDGHLDAIQWTLSELAKQPAHVNAAPYRALIDMLPRIFNHVCHSFDSPRDAIMLEHSAQRAAFNVGLDAIGKLPGSDKADAIEIMVSLLERLPNDERAASFDTLVHAAIAVPPTPIADLVPCLQWLESTEQQDRLDTLIWIATEHGDADAVEPLIAATAAVHHVADADAPPSAAEQQNRWNRVLALSHTLWHSGDMTTEQFHDALSRLESISEMLPAEQRQRIAAWLESQFNEIAQRAGVNYGGQSGALEITHHAAIGRAQAADAHQRHRP
ncbi:hypothetical protein IHE30_05375 [Mycetohabitans sp. B46]